jgi:hypothetical protein
MIEFRILGYTKSGTVADAARRFVPWIYVCVAVMALTGAVLIVGEPERSLPSFDFQMKMLFLAVALAWADKSSARTVHTTLAVLALAAWCAVVVWGRWIAYTVQH